ncbi:hypothetical protein N7462_009719 [Penicillium macrosclerotiorum]|uniref:uncharacterized protein n=1 Tax=Penicillium macrosclerotiorum TaxID=303699 RepID=UPI0025490AFF|nr:uncharacterized protein N7462_009719 [Penicillium macrosclerotiorum]KAJ5668649.1 hypothetical protein N7462_009719 [Penicillium macrosclerotiorum]
MSRPFPPVNLSLAEALGLPTLHPDYLNDCVEIVFPPQCEDRVPLFEIPHSPLSLIHVYHQRTYLLPLQIYCACLMESRHVPLMRPIPSPESSDGISGNARRTKMPPLRKFPPLDAAAQRRALSMQSESDISVLDLGPPHLSKEKNPQPTPLSDTLKTVPHSPGSLTIFGHSDKNNLLFDNNTNERSSSGHHSSAGSPVLSDALHPRNSNPSLINENRSLNVTNSENSRGNQHSIAPFGFSPGVYSGPLVGNVHGYGYGYGYSVNASTEDTFHIPDEARVDRTTTQASARLSRPPHFPGFNAVPMTNTGSDMRQRQDHRDSEDQDEMDTAPDGPHRESQTVQHKNIRLCNINCRESL